MRTRASIAAIAGLTLLLMLGSASGACSSRGSGPAAASPSAALTQGPRLAFDQQAIDGTRVSSESLQGRNTVVGFITTYDLPSQAQANFLKTIAHEHVPRTNVIAVVLERPDSLPLVRAFADMLGLRFPIVMLEANRLDRAGFPAVPAVPMSLVLDREARVVWKKTGIVEAKELASVLRGLE